MFNEENIKNMYDNIFKRKSFHLFQDNKTKQLFKDNYHITNDEIDNIYKAFRTLTPLYDSIKVEIKIVNNNLTNCNRHQEYCILFYSEKKDNYLQNIGFIGEQLDLYLANNNIGALWFGIGKTSETNHLGLEFVTMMAICKVPSQYFRKNMFKSKRKSIEEIWIGDKYLNVLEIARFAPSSCNTQPWKVIENNNKLEVYRYRNPNKRGIMPKNKIIYQNLIDIGIFILFLFVVLKYNGYDFKLYLFNDHEANNDELTKNAVFVIK